MSARPSQSEDTGVLKPGEPMENCPDAAKLHTPSPSGYIQWHNWAEKKMRTHRQRHCPTCGRLAIWVPK